MTSRPRAAPPRPPPHVTGLEATKLFDMEYFGRFVAVEDLRSRVSGYLQTIDFTDGQVSTWRHPSCSRSDEAPWRRRRLTCVCAVSLVRGSTITQQTFDQRDRAEASTQGGRSRSMTDSLPPSPGAIGDRRVSVGNLVTGGTSGGTTLLANWISSLDRRSHPLRVHDG